MIIFKINGTSYAEYINHLGTTETLRKVIGQNAGTAIDGTYIEDLIAVKHDLTVSLRPMPKAMLSALAAELAQAYVEVEYTSGLTGTVRTMNAVPSGTDVRLLMFYLQSEAIYGEASVTFTEK